MKLTIDTNPDEDQALAALARRELNAQPDDGRSDEQLVTDMIYALVENRLVRRRMGQAQQNVRENTRVRAQ